MNTLLTLSTLSLMIIASFTTNAQTQIDSKLADVQKRLPISKIQIEEQSRYFDTNYLGKRVRRLERVNMQLQGRLMFLENLVADLANFGGSGYGGGHHQQKQWTCVYGGEFVGKDVTKVGAKAKATKNCKTNSSFHCAIAKHYECEQHI